MVKTLYRQVAKEVHPDKSPDDEQRARMMRQANRAYHQDNLASLIDLCVDLDLNMDCLSASHYDMIEKNIKSVEDEINALKKTDAWYFGESDNNQQDIILKKVRAHAEKDK